MTYKPKSCKLFGKIALTILFLIGGIAWSYAEEYTPEMVPNVQLGDSSQFVSDPTHRLSTEDTRAINELIGKIRATQGVEIAVVILPAIKDDDPEGFSNKLFDLWGIGKVRQDNGLLILYVYEKTGRLIRFETGYGLEGVLPDALTYKITQDEMIPRIKEGDEGIGILAGVQAVEKYLIEGYDSGGFAEWQNDELESYVGTLRLIYFFFSAIILTLSILLTQGRLKKKTPLEQHSFLKSGVLSFNTGCLFFILSPFALILYLIWLSYKRKAIIKQVHNCPKCGMAGSVRIYENDSVNSFLSPVEQIENKINSRRFFAAYCDNCGYQEVTSKNNIISGYETCSACGGKTLKRIKIETISLNKEKVHYKCLNCHLTESKIRRRSTQPGYTTFGGGSFGGGRSGSFGGGSWGGGRSGGGGSTSRF